MFLAYTARRALDATLLYIMIILMVVDDWRSDGRTRYHAWIEILS